MFEKRRQREEEAARAEALTEWNAKLTELESLLQIATRAAVPALTHLITAPGERGVGEVTGVGLVQERRGPGHYAGAGQGVSIPIGHVAGRPVRYRVGATRGHYVQGAPVATVVDTGTLSITDRRLVYQGSQHTSECDFARLVGIDHEPGQITVSVAHREHPTVLHFGAAVDDWVQDRLSLALALFKGQDDQVREGLEAQIAELHAAHPGGPAA